eukprot:8874457-Alexandrium_andersonii.AAC.1
MPAAKRAFSGAAAAKSSSRPRRGGSSAASRGARLAATAPAEAFVVLPPALAALPLTARSEPFLPVEDCRRFTKAVTQRLRAMPPPGKT